MSDIASGDFPTPNSLEEQYLQAIISNQLGDDVDLNAFPAPISRLEQYLQAIIANQGSGSGTTITAINLNMDSVGLITDGTATLSDGSSVPITITTEGDVVTQAQINDGLDTIIESEDSYIGE